MLIFLLMQISRDCHPIGGTRENVHTPGETLAGKNTWFPNAQGAGEPTRGGVRPGVACAGMSPTVLLLPVSQRRP
jgi:hypothetical protein